MHLFVLQTQLVMECVFTPVKVPPGKGAKRRVTKLVSHRNEVAQQMARDLGIKLPVMKKILGSTPGSRSHWRLRRCQFHPRDLWLLVAKHLMMLYTITDLEVEGFPQALDHLEEALTFAVSPAQKNVWWEDIHKIRQTDEGIGAGSLTNFKRKAVRVVRQPPFSRSLSNTY